MLFQNRQTQYYTYTWNKEWITEYESPWSILKKFQYANCLSTNNIYDILGRKNGKIYRDLYTLSGFDDHLLEKALQFPLKKENNAFLIDILEPLMDSKELEQGYLRLYFMRDFFTFCPVCISNTYHSLLHQFIFIHKCPFHPVPLKDTCPNCNQKIPYELDDQYFKSPFTCICGFKFAQLDRRITTFKTPVIKDSNVHRWLNLCMNSTNHRLDHLFFLEALRKDPRYMDQDFTYELADLFSVINKKGNIISTKSNIEQIKSKGQITKNLTKKGLKCQLLNNQELSVVNLKDESVKICNQLFNSIARQLRKTVLRKHIGCIKHFTRYHDDITKKELCPFAVAYVVWRMRLQHYRGMGEVDNFAKPPLSKLHITSYGYPVNHGYELISDFLNQLKLAEKYGTHAIYHWKMNRFVGEHILSDFKRCLVAAEGFIDGKDFNWNYIDSFKHLTRAIIEPPTGPNKKYYLYVNSINTIEEFTKRLNCPNDRVKKRMGPKEKYKYITELEKIFNNS
ncbi:hypothetical protein [Virgibacillus oceani]|uniref:Uncharacterized protein n=1 Tax=Virgibacillus oceani TaxID=1479511 RepID=A0A917M676_9BACI|nr:hypothetical protein [Virgibacillus oceani]GGG77577.1 hypothetical protein GCM10011398_23360 [Virgibacillus oceani]